jgi:hypothetical protein
MALLRLTKVHGAARLPLDSAELPDHLTIVLAFAALAPPGDGEALPAEQRPAIELLRLLLYDVGSPYAYVLDAVALLPGLSVCGRRGGPPGARGAAGRGGRPRAVRAAGGDAGMSAGSILLSGVRARPGVIPGPGLVRGRGRRRGRRPRRLLPPLVRGAVKSATGGYKLGFVLVALVAVVCLAVLRALSPTSSR